MIVKKLRFDSHFVTTKGYVLIVKIGLLRAYIFQIIYTKKLPKKISNKLLQGKNACRKKKNLRNFVHIIIIKF